VLTFDEMEGDHD
jgi:hypothetical protein